MITIKTLIDLEEILLKADSVYKFKYSMDELIKSETYLKEIGSITDIFFNTLFEYSKINSSNEEKVNEYQKKLYNDTIDFDITKYVKFISDVKDKIDNEEIANLIERFMQSQS